MITFFNGTGEVSGIEQGRGIHDVTVQVLLSIILQFFIFFKFELKSRVLITFGIDCQ